MDGIRTPEQQEVSPLQQEIAHARAKIIDDVLREGLKSGNQMLEEGKTYLGSFHRGINPHPHWTEPQKKAHLYTRKR